MNSPLGSRQPCPWGRFTSFLCEYEAIVEGDDSVCSAIPNAAPSTGYGAEKAIDKRSPSSKNEPREWA